MQTPFPHLATYHITRKIAEGGMGAVYEAIQEGSRGFRKKVAIKILRSKLAQHDKFVEMLVQEAKLVADLVHENIVQMYQLGECEEGYFMVLEYVHGLSLYEFLKLHRENAEQIPPELAVFIASRVARGLTYAHSRLDAEGRRLGIVHRDVSSKNILITSEGLPKLADFGLAIVSNKAGEDDMKNLVGKLRYMSPEQARMQVVDHRADIFALGALLFELLSLKEIRGGTSQEELLSKAEEGFVEWKRLPESISQELCNILKKSLALRVEDRFESTQQFATELEYFIYQGGYGPTIQTLEVYLRSKFPKLYDPGNMAPLNKGWG